MSYKVISGPTALFTASATEPHHAVEDATDHAFIDQELIPAAQKFLGAKYDRAIGTQTIEETFDNWPSGQCLELTIGPVDSITSVEYYDEDDVLQTLASTSYWENIQDIVTRIFFKDDVTLPDLKVRPDAVRVTYVAGTTVPEPVRLAMMELIADYNLKREDYQSDINSSISRLFRHSDELIYPFVAIRV